VTYFAAAMIIAGVALFVAAPLAGGFFPGRRAAREDLERARLEHERGLAVQGLRELEFDREMGKLSDADYQALRAGLERRALTAMEALEKLRAPRSAGIGSREKSSQVRRIDSARSAASLARSQSPRKINFCPQCGVRTAADARFCGECGLALRTRDRATGQAD